MTEHNKILGILHLAYAGLNLLIMIFMAVFMFGMFGVFAANEQGAPAGIMLVVMGLVVAINLIFTLPSFVAGFGLLKHKRWAKVAGIVAGVVDALSVPLGTALSVYTFWFLFSERGRALYEKRSRELPPPPPRWDVPGSQARVGEYVPPVGARINPPDWR